MSRLAIVLLVLAASLPLRGGDAYTVHPIGSTEAPYGYLEHLPADYRKGGKAKYPLVFFLHGLGELGDSDKELTKIANHGPLKLIANHDPVGKVFDQESAIVVAPQGLKADGWWRTEKLIATFNHILKEHPVDPDRLYVTGLSMGGGGTWSMAIALPDKIAAIVPICGASKPGNGDAAKLRGMPIWANHAINDPTVKFPDSTQAFFDAVLTDQGLQPQGGVMTGYTHGDKPWIGVATRKGWQWQEGTAPPASKDGPPPLLLTVYPDGSHDSWTRTYENPVVWAWLFSQSRAKRAKPEAKH